MTSLGVYCVDLKEKPSRCSSAPWKTDLRDSSIQLWSKNCSKRSWILNMNAAPHSFYCFFYLLKNVTYSNLQQRKEIKRQQYVWKSFFFPTETERPRSARKKQSDVFVFDAQWKKQTAVRKKDDEKKERDTKFTPSAPLTNRSSSHRNRPPPRPSPRTIICFL